MIHGAWHFLVKEKDNRRDQECKHQINPHPKIRIILYDIIEMQITAVNSCWSDPAENTQTVANYLYN